MQNQKIYLNLASTNLKINRQERYDGGGFSVSLNDLAPEDVSLVLRLYQSLKGIYDLWLYMGESPNYQLLRAHLKQFCTTEFLMGARAIGVATYTLDNPPPELRKACHDLRGGALSSLAGYAKLIPRLPEDDNWVRKAVFMARDHAKMMRNILPDLDVAIRAADEVHYHLLIHQRPIFSLEGVYCIFADFVTLLAKLTKSKCSQMVFANKAQSGANAANREGTVPKLEVPHHQSQTRTRLIAATVIIFCNPVLASPR